MNANKKCIFPVLCGIMLVFGLYYCIPITSSVPNTSVNRELSFIENTSTRRAPAIITPHSLTENATLKLNSPLPPTLPAQFIPLTKSTVDGVEKFVFFIGYPRSGHSIIGSYMDSHPNMIIAHEYPLFKTLKVNRMSKFEIFNRLYKKSFDELQQGWRGSINVQNKGYSLALDGLWQATFDKLKVIGNKHGGATVQFYRKDPRRFVFLLDYLKKTVTVPIYVIHVVRNPFDMIATQSLYTFTRVPGVKVNASLENKFNKPKLLTSVAEDMLERAKVAGEMINKFRLPTLQLYHEDLIHDPVQVMKSVCGFLEVGCSDYYLKKCKEKTFSSSSKSRYVVVWPQSLIQSLLQQIRNITFFSNYSFSD